jgi:hypothetical protein
VIYTIGVAIVYLAYVGLVFCLAPATSIYAAKLSGCQAGRLHIGPPIIDTPNPAQSAAL